MIEQLILAIIVGGAAFVAGRRLLRKLGSGSEGCRDGDDCASGCGTCAEAQPQPPIPAANLVKRAHK